jgi:ribosome biogenesis GTPase A
MKKEIPGHIKKAFKSIDRFLPVVDVIVELVDARMPEGSRLSGYTGRLGKQRVIALGKSDLADKKETRKWVERYRSEGCVCVALDARKKSSVKKLAELIKKSAFTSTTKGIAPNRKVRRVMIIGIPNVGKSTLINSLAGRKAARSANTPGVTRDVQWIKLSGKLELLDLPGILDFGLLGRGNILKLINTIPGKDQECFEQAVLLCRVLVASGCASCVPGLEQADNKYEHFLSDYARKMNFLIKGGELDLHRAAADMIKRFQAGRFGAVTIEKADSDFNSIYFDDEETDNDKNFKEVEKVDV